VASGSERWRGGASKFSVQIFFEKSSDFVQEGQPARKSQIFGSRLASCLPAGMALGDQIVKEFWLKKSIGGFVLNLIQSKRKFL
jgi:hypothetical protein